MNWFAFSLAEEREQVRRKCITFNAELDRLVNEPDALKADVETKEAQRLMREANLAHAEERGEEPRRSWWSR